MANYEFLDLPMKDDDSPVRKLLDQEVAGSYGGTLGRAQVPNHHSFHLFRPTPMTKPPFKSHGCWDVWEDLYE